MAFGTLRADTIQADGGTAKTVDDIVVSGGDIGTATATTPATGDNNTNVATTEFVKAQNYLTSGADIGAATASTPTPATDDSTKVATTAFVKDQLDVASTWTAPQRGEVTAVTHSSATIDINFSDSNNFHIQLVSGTANVTSITASNAVAGQSGSIFIQQPASGTAVTFSGWASEYKFPARTPLAGITATLNGVDRVDYVVKDPNEIHCVSTLDMAP